MTTASTSAGAHAVGTRRKARRRGGIEFGLLYALAFTIFLIAAVVTRIIRFATWQRATSGTPRSILREAREATGATIPYAFMG